MACNVAFDGALWFPLERQPPGSDPVYKRLYACPEMVADLLRSLFPDDALGADYETLRRLPGEYVADDYRQRRGDAVWLLNAEAVHGGWLHMSVASNSAGTLSDARHVPVSRRPGHDPEAH